MSEGFVYAMTNPDYPGSFKVGMTTKTPEDRAKSLSTSTGVRSPFSIYKAVYTPIAAEHERVAHQQLMEYREFPNKEFFSAPPQVIDVVFEGLSLAVDVSDWWLPFVTQRDNDAMLVPPIDEKAFKTAVAKERFRKADLLEIAEDGTVPHTINKGGVYHVNCRLPKELGGGTYRRSLRTADPDMALIEVQVILKCIAADLDEALTSGNTNE